jgi:hypothetical protein
MGLEQSWEEPHQETIKAGDLQIGVDCCRLKPSMQRQMAIGTPKG